MIILSFSFRNIRNTIALLCCVLLLLHAAVAQDSVALTVDNVSLGMTQEAVEQGPMKGFKSFTAPDGTVYYTEATTREYVPGEDILAPGIRYREGIVERVSGTDLRANGFNLAIALDGSNPILPSDVLKVLGKPDAIEKGVTPTGAPFEIWNYNQMLLAVPFRDSNGALRVNSFQLGN